VPRLKIPPPLVAVLPVTWVEPVKMMVPKFEMPPPRQLVRQ
jgi:hypothetical protein